MGNYNVGDMIRLSRIAKKMTQEELSEGVCSVETLSRIENGKHKVKSDTYRQLMEKMYQITEKNYAVCVSRDMELIEEREYFEDAMAKHDFEKADFYMEQMKKLVGKDASTQRYIRRESTFLDYYMQRITAEQLVEALEELAEEVRKVNPRAEAAASVEEALQKSWKLAGKKDVIVAFGSLSFLGRVDRAVQMMEE